MLFKNKVTTDIVEFIKREGDKIIFMPLDINERFDFGTVSSTVHGLDTEYELMFKDAQYCPNCGTPAENEPEPKSRTEAGINMLYKHKEYGWPFEFVKRVYAKKGEKSIHDKIYRIPLKSFRPHFPPEVQYDYINPWNLNYEPLFKDDTCPHCGYPSEIKNKKGDK